jgi:hypothetical protein
MAVRQSYRQAIETRYAGPTNSRGSRIIVTAQAGRLIVPWDDALDVNENHAVAAQMFIDRMGWGGNWVGGGTEDGFVFVQEDFSPSYGRSRRR